MASATVATLTKMLEKLPTSAQERVIEHLREYIEDLRDELQWDKQFSTSQSKLTAAARTARKQSSAPCAGHLRRFQHAGVPHCHGRRRRTSFRHFPRSQSQSSDRNSG